MMRRQILIFGAIGVVMVALAIVAWSKADRARSPHHGSSEKIVMGSCRNIYSLPLLIAETRGIFTKNGLTIDVRDYESGLLALSGLLKGEVEMATVADYAFVGESLKHDDLRIIASIATSASEEFVARKDREIELAADLKGKRIGVNLNTGTEFTLVKFLTFNQISRDEVTLVDLNPSRLVEAISSGNIDAMISWDTWVFEAKKRLGTNAVSWPATVGQDFYWMLVVKKNLIESKLAAIDRFLRSMAEADDFIKAHKEECLGVLVRDWNLDPAYILYAWEKNRFALSLEQGILTALEDEADWKIRHSGSIGLAVPNYLRFVYLDGLAGINPKAVTIYR